MFDYKTLSPARRLFIDAVVDKFPDVVASGEITRSQIQDVVDSTGLNFPQWFTTSHNSVSRGVFKFPSPETSNSVSQEVLETDDEIEKRIDDRFAAITNCVKSVALGDIKSLILSGNPGIGKTYEVAKTLEHLDNTAQCNFVFVSGRTKATGLYKLLYDNRFPDSVLVLDDIDSALDNEDSLNILKKACDLRQVRKISWLSEARMVSEEDGEEIPKSFEYEGSIIFITNKDFGSIMKKDSKLSPHLEALISRSLYINLGVNTSRDILIRIKQVLDRGMLSEKGFTETEQTDIYQFVVDNVNRVWELSLRMVEKLSILYRANPENWKSIAEITCFRK